MRELMFCGKPHVAGHNTELLEEMRHYHRDDDFKVVKQRHHLIDAFRYALMMRRSGRPRLECEGVGFGAMPMRGTGPSAAASRRWRAGSEGATGIFSPGRRSGSERAVCSMRQTASDWTRRRRGPR